MRILLPFLSLMLIAGSLSGQNSQIITVFERSEDEVSHLLLERNGDKFVMSDVNKARTYDLAEIHPELSLSGDFNGDGMDETAIFEDLLYMPNLNPEFTCSIISINRFNGEQFVPSGTWFSTLDTVLDFEYVSFSVAGDYTLDGLDDIVFFYNDPASEQVAIYLLESSGSGFSEAQAWYTTDRNEFNFTALEFACAGDFNANGQPDIAVFYNYFGTSSNTKQSIFIFESDGSSFTLLPAAYSGTKADYDFSNMKFAFSGNFNQDSYSDIAVLLDDSLNNQLLIPVFVGSAAAQLSPVEYASIQDSELEFSNILHASAGNFAGDTATDLTLFYDNFPGSKQEVLVLECESGSFKAAVSAFETDAATLPISGITAVLSGTFVDQVLVSAATWKDDHRGAISFTFDDGYRGAFEHGGAELEAAGLKGTFYIFTDTTTIYDGELAGTNLVREYRQMGHEIASHTDNHSNLGFLTESGDLDSLEQVLSISVELLNERFDQQTMSMSIPFGSFRYETLGYISQYFYSARSSQFGYNLATPYDFFTLRSWPILSTTSPAYVDNLLATAETYGTWLPLMYHDMVDEPFDEEIEIYNYSRELFRETVQDAADRDLWIDTHERVYKYIRERNALKIKQLNIDNLDAETGHFSFEADDALPDSIFDVELTLKIFFPDSWTADSVSIGTGEGFEQLEVLRDSLGSYVLYNWLPVSGVIIEVHEGKFPISGFTDRPDSAAKLRLTAAPNPFLYKTFIRVSGTSTNNIRLIVRDITGRILQEYKMQNTGNYRLLRDDLPSGIYIIQVMDGATQLGSLKLFAQ